jgi:ribosome maturation factor RimP
MISKALVEELMKDKLEELGLFVVELEISGDNRISLKLDGDKPVSMDDCIAVSRSIEHNLDREKEDFELMVSSAGITAPFVVWRQYLKNVGMDVEVVLESGEKFKGLLEKAEDERISLFWKSRERVEGKKKKIVVEHRKEFGLDEIKRTKLILKF